MSEPSWERTNEEYRAALEKKNIELMRQRAQKIALEAEKKKRIARAKKEHEAEKLKKQIAQTKDEIREYERRLEKAKKIAAKPIYGLAATATLVLFGITFVVSIVFYLFRGRTPFFTVTLVMAFLLLSVSIFAQTMDIEGDEKVQEYEQKIRRAKRELSDLERRRS